MTELNNTPPAPGSTPGTPGEPNTPPGQTPAIPNPPPLPGQTPPPSGKTPIESLPPDIQVYIANLRDENKSARKRAERADELERAARQAEEARLAAQGQYKELAERHEAKVRELEPVAAKYDALAKLVASQIAAETKDWPQEVKALDPGPQASIEERLGFVERSRPLVARLTAQGSSPGMGPNPRPAGQSSPEQQNREMTDKLRRSQQYPVF